MELNLDKHWDFAGSKVLLRYIMIPYANVIRCKILWRNVGFSVGTILEESGVSFEQKKNLRFLATVRIVLRAICREKYLGLGRDSSS